VLPESSTRQQARIKEGQSAIARAAVAAVWPQIREEEGKVEGAQNLGEG
jgi:hypothetical protein